MDPAVGLAKAYLELCGYFVLAELPVRAGGLHGYRDVTDLDVLAVRFPHATHPEGRPLDVYLGLDPALGTDPDVVDVVIGEVKEGAAASTPPSTAPRASPSRCGGRCHLRLVAFAGYGAAAERGVRTVHLGHCAAYIVERLREAGDVLAGAQFKDPVVGLLALQQKVAAALAPVTLTGSAGTHDERTLP